MKAHTHKTGEPENRSVAGGIAQKKAHTEAVSAFADNRPEAVAQRKLQQAANGSARSMELGTLRETANAAAKPVQMQETGHAHAPVAQLQKANGAYKVAAGTNLRNDDKKHTVRAKFPEDTAVFVVNKGPRVSNFKAGWVTNEHSWVQVDVGEDTAQGWVEDSKLNPAGVLQNQFAEGDKLYGRYETRREVTQSGRPENRRVGDARYNIIDDVNDEMRATRPGGGSEEVESFRAYVGENTKRPRAGHQDLINQYCKAALVHYTNSDHTIHFMLDGIDPELVLRETKAKREGDDFEYDDESMGGPRVTSIELRALMRAAMRAQGIRGGKADSEGHDIRLEKVKFYLNNVEVSAPWAAQANSLWGRAWQQYLAEKRG